MSYSKKLKHPKWQKRRLEILQRDNFTCQKCDDTETELHVHHKEYLGNPWDATDEMLETVCAHCHFCIEDLKEDYSIVSIEKAPLNGGGSRLYVVTEDKKDYSTEVNIYESKDEKIKYVLSIPGFRVESICFSIYKSKTDAKPNAEGLD